MHALTGISSPYLKVLLPLMAILAVLAVGKYKYRLSFKQDLYFNPPVAAQLVLWLAIGMAWMLATDYFMHWRGAWNFVPWQNQPFIVSVLRVLAVCMLGPIAEELVCRGLIFYRLKQLKLANPWVLVVVIAAGWAAIHTDYDWKVIGVIFIFGVMLGAGMIRSRSIVTPILMHMAWNLYAVW